METLLFKPDVHLRRWKIHTPSISMDLSLLVVCAIATEIVRVVNTPSIISSISVFGGYHYYRWSTLTSVTDMTNRLRGPNGQFILCVQSRFHLMRPHEIHRHPGYGAVLLRCAGYVRNRSSHVSAQGVSFCNLTSITTRCCLYCCRH